MKNEGGQANADAQAHHPNEASPKGFVFGVERVIHSVLFTAFYSQLFIHNIGLADAGDR